MKTIQLRAVQTFEPPLRFPGVWYVALQEITCRLPSNDYSVAYETKSGHTWKERVHFTIPRFSSLDQFVALCNKNVPWHGAYVVKKSSDATVDILMPNNGTSRLRLYGRLQRVFPSVRDGIILSTTKEIKGHLEEFDPGWDIRVHADFISNYFVFGHYQPLLRCIPWNPKEVDFQLTPHHLQWYPLTCQEMTSFGLTLLDSQSQPIDTKDLSVTLAFKQTSAY